MEQVTYNGLVVLRWIECVGAVSPKTEMDNPSNIPSSSIRLIYLEFLFFWNFEFEFESGRLFQGFQAFGL